MIKQQILLSFVLFVVSVFSMALARQLWQITGPLTLTWRELFARGFAMLAGVALWESVKIWSYGLCG